MELPKLILTDIDGVWTDGGMYYDQTGNEWKKFNTYDSAGVLFAHRLNIPVGIITGENTEIVSRRAKKLNVDHVLQGAKDKLPIAMQLCKDLDIDIKDVAYIGDDILDIVCMRESGLVGCPADACPEVKELAHFISSLKGGEGAVREFVEYVIRYNQSMQS